MISIDVDAAVVVPVNSCPLIDDTDFKTRETAVAYNAAGMDLVWNFITSAGAVTQTAVTPTTAGVYDWTHVGDGMYSIEIPASGGASINNDTEGYGYFTGVATGVLPWRGPTIRFRAAGLNDLMTDSAYSATRGLAGTALPAAAADAAGGLPISDAGGLDLDAKVGALTFTVANKVDANATHISGDSVAADNLEAAADGTGYNLGGGAVVAASVTGAVGSVSGAVGSVTGNVGGNVTGSVGSVAGAVGSVTGNVGGNVTGSVGSVAGAVGSVTGNVGGNVTGSVGSVASYGTLVADVATAVWGAGTKTLTSFGTLVSDIWASFNATQFAKFFSVDSGTTYASAVAGSVVKEIADNASGGGGGGASQYQLVGTFFRSGATYYWLGHLCVNGSVVTSGLSSLAVVDVRGNNGATDLSYSASTAATIGTNGTLYGAFTLGTAPTDGQPCALTVTVVYGGTTYRGRFLAAGVP